MHGCCTTLHSLPHLHTQMDDIVPPGSTLQQPLEEYTLAAAPCQPEALHALVEDAPLSPQDLQEQQHQQAQQQLLLATSPIPRNLKPGHSYPKPRSPTGGGPRPSRVTATAVDVHLASSPALDSPIVADSPEILQCSSPARRNLPPPLTLPSSSNAKLAHSFQSLQQRVHWDGAAISHPNLVELGGKSQPPDSSCNSEGPSAHSGLGGGFASGLLGHSFTLSGSHAGDGMARADSIGDEVGHAVRALKGDLMRLSISTIPTPFERASRSFLEAGV